ncbi:hypothetical protein PVIIG_05632 [Plasmodium vivax India VII]|uniref:Uncharacterized protein n=1 Tax=Plasmodium vivax India VII TaxID=1077284 RepID=A0A0J9S3N5_PLAVI|nr:hypothetical protein PVIIG_05632 [Plasmodium vivax India VII]
MKSFDSSINISKRCEYLAYWIYDNIMKSKSCDNNKEFYQKLNDLKNKKIMLHDICNITNFEIGKDAFEIKKKLYLLGEILYSIQKKYESNTYLQKYSYDEFFRECVDIYKESISGINCNIRPDYNSELTKFKEHFDAAKSFLNGKGVGIKYDLKKYKESVCPEQSKALQKGAGGESEQQEEASSEKQDGVGPEAQGKGTEAQGKGPEAQGKGSEAAGLKTVGSEVSEQTGPREQLSASVVEAGSRTETEILQTAKEDSFNGEATIVPGINEDTSESFIPKNDLPYFY